MANSKSTIIVNISSSVEEVVERLVRDQGGDCKVRIVGVEVGEELYLAEGRQVWGSGGYSESFEVLAGVAEDEVGDKTVTDFITKEDHCILVLDEETVVVSHKADFNGSRYTVYLAPRAYEAWLRAQTRNQEYWTQYWVRAASIEEAVREEVNRASKAGWAGKPYTGPCGDIWMEARKASIRRQRAMMKEYRKAACRGLVPSGITANGRVWSA